MRRATSRRGGPRHRTSVDRARGTLLAAAAGTVVVMLAACSSSPVPSQTSAPPTLSATSAAPSVTATTSAPPVLVADGTAADNLPLFRSVVESIWASADAVRGAAYVDALTAAGFDRAAMQLTSDTTTIGQAAESIQFSVAWRDGCLVGQVGPATGDPVVAVLPLLAGGRCLVGETVDLDG